MGSMGVLALFMAFTGAVVAPEASAKTPVGFWEKSLRAFRSYDAKNPTKGGVVFVGSSSIRRWSIARAFPSLPAVNRGLGGAHIDDVIGYVELLVLSRAPKVIVFYAGENDIGAGATPERILDDYRTFAGLVHARLPATTIVFLSIKPSPVLRHAWPRAREANRLVEAFSASDARLRYVDVASPMLGPTGKPRRELFVKDGLHMNDAGYRLWNELVTPVVQAAFTAP